MGFRFKLIKETPFGRVGEIETPHGSFETPVFMPVGSKGSVKAISPRDLEALGAKVILSNTYHLYLRPGIEVIREVGGLHKFMGWRGAILTDSGGYQVFSLCKFSRVLEEGVEFRSHLDGSLHLLTPEKVVQIQAELGVDIAMVLDECLPYPVERSRAKASVELNLRWAKRAKNAWKAEGALFGIVQGSVFMDLRKQCIEGLLELDFHGYALGGLSVGEPKELTWDVVQYSCELLPKDKPRYLMGMGTPEDILEGVKRGIDMFDCVLPTRFGRTGYLFTRWGVMNIKHARYAHDPAPIDPDCNCYTCKNFSRAYLRHLFLSRELLSYYLNTLHNLHYYLQLMEQIRKALREDRFPEFMESFHRQRGKIAP